MPTLLQKLENNEAILLMYLADELPAEDRAEVEQLLATDANLRAELERIRTAHEEVMSALQSLDAAAPPPVSRAAAVRQVSRAMKQWQTDRLSATPPVAVPKGLRYPWWVYPAASAAAIVIASIVWWGMNPDVPKDSSPLTLLSTDDKVEALTMSYAESDQIGGQLPEAEQQANALARSTHESSTLLVLEQNQ